MKRRCWTDEQFRDAVARHSNFTDVLRALGLRPAGGNHRAMKVHAARLGVDLRHFSTERRRRGIDAYREGIRIDAGMAFVNRSAVSRSVIRRLARTVLSPYACAACGNEGSWLGKPLTLQLDHANGEAEDHRLENLRWLCPNCHSQTRTFAGRGSRRSRPAAHLGELSFDAPTR
jgi:5-methylcytosine-specific restriction endonuclease McrA